MWGGHSREFPKAIVHIDGDSFFVGCEVAKDPSLKGKYVVTGKERGIASALSYEAKARGAKRGMSLSEIRKLCPGLIVLPSDYETYSMYSERMYNILKRYTPEVEEYSIDECFADITGIRQAFHTSYKEIADKIKNDLYRELGITFSVGLSVNKVLAKVASKWKKPFGLTVIPKSEINDYLKKITTGSIWGIGPNTAEVLLRWKIRTGYDFASQKPEWIEEKFSKPVKEIFYELNGHFILPLSVGHKESYASVSKTKTFTPPNSQKSFILSQLSKNLENACIKIRRYNLFAKRVSFYIKTNEFKYFGTGFTLTEPLSTPQDIMKVIRELFEKIYKPNILYRASGVTLSGLVEKEAITLDLFGNQAKVESINKIYEVVDHIDRKFGKHTVFLGSSMEALNNPQHAGSRGNVAERSRNIFKGETNRKRINLPYLGFVK